MKKLLNLILSKWSELSEDCETNVSHHSSFALTSTRGTILQFQSTGFRVQEKPLSSHTNVNHKTRMPFVVKLAIFPFYFILIVLVEIAERLSLFDEEN